MRISFFLLLPIWVFSMTSLWGNASVVYDDALASDWTDWSWGGNYDFSNTTEVQVGTNAIAATYTEGYAGLNLRKGSALDGNTITAVRFWVKSDGAHDIQVYTASDDGSGASQEKVFPTTSTWQQITIDFSELGFPSVVKRLIFQNWSADANFLVYFDEIEFLTSSSPTTTDVIYDDVLAPEWASWSWDGNYDFSNTTVVQAGNNAIAATYTGGYGALNLRKETSIIGNTILSIRFWAKSDGAHDIQVNTASTDDGGSASGQVITTSSAWQQFTVSMGALGDPSTVKRLLFQNWSTDVNFTVYYDQIELLLNDNPPPPVNEVLIRVDQFGYLPDAEKVAVLSDPQIGANANLSYNPPTQLEIRNANTDTVVYTGNINTWSNGDTHAQSGDKGWWFDFSSLTTPGEYYVYDPINQEGSAVFKIGSNVYDEVMQAAFKMFYYNRSNIEKIEPYVEAGYTDDNSFLQDANCRYVNDRNNSATEKDLRGGWFDAGDYNKYVTFTLSVMHNLLWTYEENPELFGDDWNIPESGNGIPDILDEIKWELDWLLKMTNSDGSVHIKMGAIEYGQNDASPPSANTQFPRYYGPTCTSASITNAGIFAHASKVFANIPSLTTYAQTLENNAISTWNYSLAFLNNNTLETACDDGTIKSGDADREVAAQREDALVAAVHLFDLTSNSSYEQYVTNNLNDAEQIAIPFWGCYKLALNDALLLYTTLPNTNANTVNAILNAVNTDVGNNGNNYFGFSEGDLYRAFMPDWSYHWGSNQASAGYGVVNLQMKKYGIFPTSSDAYERKASEQVHYFHGVNPMGLVYLSNMYDQGGDACINEIYHAWFNDGNPLYDNVSTSTYGPPPGYLVGGPNQNYTISSLSPPYGEPMQKAYLDFNTSNPYNSWEISEPAIYYQAVYLRLLAPYVNNICVSRLDDNDVGTTADDLLYQANESIAFSGAILENANVSFQAGDFILLQDGFVAKNTNFSATIGSCGLGNEPPEREGIAEERTAATEEASASIILNNIQISPNPTEGEFQLTYSLEEADLVRIRILNQTGKVVQSISYPQQMAGTHQEQFSLSWDGTGIYIVMVQIGEQVRSLRVVVSR